jgi:ribonuclease VapC
VIVDSSAIVAIIHAEADAARFADALAGARRPMMSAVNYVESAVVVDARRDPVTIRRFDELMRSTGIETVAVTAEQAMIARQAYRDFGRGSGSPARLNFGDCFAYALASATGQPLLYKGNDFIHTDLVSALPLPEDPSTQ